MEKLANLLKDPVNNFSLLISELIKCESEYRDDEATLLTDEFLKRNVENEEECLLYSSL